jgi:hypothetical protein
LLAVMRLRDRLIVIPGEESAFLRSVRVLKCQFRTWLVCP